MFQITSAITGSIFLTIFFAAVRSQWPTSYQAIAEPSLKYISESPLNYILFRLGPVFFTTLIAGGVVERSGRASLSTVLGIAFLHSTMTAGRSFLQLVRGNGIARHPMLAFFHLVVAVAVFGVSLLSVPLASRLGELLPTADDAVIALVTAALAATAGAFLIGVTRVDDSLEAMHRSLAESRRSIGDETWWKLREAAEACNSDPILVQAVALVENIQRPLWFRSVEGLLGRIFRNGSYGLLQVRQSSPTLSGDLYSQIADRFEGQRPPKLGNRSTLDTQWIGLFLQRYNPSAAYVAAAQNAYEWIQYFQPTEALAYSFERSDDGLPTIEVTEFVTRDGGWFHCHGTALAVDSLTLVGRDGLHEIVERHSISCANLGRRSDWSIGVGLIPATRLIEIEAATPGGGASVFLPVIHK